jgi:hypothetical protein
VGVASLPGSAGTDEYEGAACPPGRGPEAPGIAADAPLLGLPAVEQDRKAAGATLVSVCIAGHVVATLLVVGPLLLLQLLGHVLATRFGASPDFLVQVLVAEPLALVLLGLLAVIELGTGIGLLRWRPTAIPRSAVLASVAMLAMIWSSMFPSLRIAMKHLTEPYPGNGQELLVLLNWFRLVLAVARAMLVTWMLGRLAGASSRVQTPL